MGVYFILVGEFYEVTSGFFGGVFLVKEMAGGFGTVKSGSAHAGDDGKKRGGVFG